jgi:hypothetical protein
VKQDRTLVISRKYQKGPETYMLHVAQISGNDIEGTVFQFELWPNGAQEPTERLASGNRYGIRRAFIDKLLDLHENGWSRQGAGAYGHPDRSFFDPAEL